MTKSLQVKMAHYIWTEEEMEYFIIHIYQREVLRSSLTVDLVGQDLMRITSDYGTLNHSMETPANRDCSKF